MMMLHKIIKLEKYEHFFEKKYKNGKNNTNNK